MLRELLSLPGQETRLLRLITPLGDQLLTPECVRGEEALSGGFRFRITALSPDAGLSLRALLGQPVLLELQTTLGEARPFHGHITSAEANGANGGLARYTLTLEPWLAFLGHNRDSRIFQDKNVLDILDAIFGAWQGQGKLAPAWRFEVQDRGRYPVRSLTTQYQESDLAFAERLMHEEGLFHYFVHSKDGHELVIADDNSSFKPNAQAQVRFTQPGAVMREDSMDRWRSELKLQTNAVELHSWDYRTLDKRPVSAASLDAAADALLASRDAPGAYAYPSRAHGQRIADQQLQALEASREVYTGAGTVRTLSPGTTFNLSEHALGDDSFLVTRVVHLAHNNLGADLHAGLMQRLGESALGAAIAAEQASSLHAVGKEAGERPLYRNRIDAIRASVPYRASGTDGHGRLLHPRPTMQGQQTAVVVGPAGAAVHTDRDHRVKVQFHWQRGDAGHSRLNHPAPGSHSGAPADDSVGAWVRVATPLAPQAGANWGSNAVPRVGQEVLVDFIDGNIDRPVVIGALYNGQGQADAQHNQVAQGGGASTGNAPAWFPGTTAGHAHPAALSGLKSQALPASQGGSGAYSQLVFDDTPGQPRLGLQRHASPHQGTDELNLGNLRHQTDNQRLQPAGFGAELKSEHSAALRAGRGMLLSADLRNGGSGHQLDAREGQAQIEQAQALQTTLATTAQKQNAKLKSEPEPEKLPAIAQMASSAQALSASGSGLAGDAGGGGQAAAFSAAMMQLSAPAGIAATTPASAVIAAGATSTLAAGQDINLLAQANSLHAVRDGISLFTYGKASSADKPNQETGIRLHAASGKLSSQSQNDATSLTADRLVTVASVSKDVRMAAKEHVLLTAQGAYLKLEGGNIEVHGPGTMTFKASMKELTGPAQSTPALPELPNEKLYAGRFQVKDALAGTAIAGRLYKKQRADGKVFFGKTDAEGHTTPVNTAKEEQLAISLDHNEKFHRDKIDEDELNQWFS
ncbi:type VI secretion system tip protein VgrG [Pseudoduganella sp. FT55W]|uniref:Type VI secretion system tip protein VgrG n=1 Tax=Duganella rivi TaxID=2666083 RepID=A0A7X4GPU8_9BURK|nr:type VI secretion system Vgr family protein [Duganella rivi]MYM66916.1 type VI secretion system tip protein VgrG [Duganella rivi]